MPRPPRAAAVRNGGVQGGLADGVRGAKDAGMTDDAPALPPVVDLDTWRRELAALRVREKAATRELDAIAAQRRRLPMVELPDYVLEGPDGPVRLVDLFGDRR